MHIIHTRPFLTIWCCQVIEIHISFFSAGLPNYIRKCLPSGLFFLTYLEYCVSVSFRSINFTEVLYSLPSVHLPVTANVLHPKIFSSVEADRSLNSLIPVTLHTTYSWIFLPGKNLLGTCFPHALYLHP